ncbi:hypothetical protein THAOC_29956, partial [Thalassiosira oceanica]
VGGQPEGAVREQVAQGHARGIEGRARGGGARPARRPRAGKGGGVRAGAPRTGPTRPSAPPAQRG